MYGYSVILVILTIILSFLIIRRTDVQTTILRASGTLYQIRDKDQTVSNLYTAEMVNKTGKAIEFEIIPDDKNARIQYIQKSNMIAYGSSVKVTFFVIMPLKAIKEYKSKISFKLFCKGKTVDRFETTFIAPSNN
ncbi:FixG Ig-like domain-containing protein [Pedobacter steynii]